MPALALMLALALTAHGPARNARPAPQAEQQPPAAEAPDTQALTDAEIADRVQTYLGAIDQPIPTENWRALGPRGAAALAEVAVDPKAFPSRRARAISALALVGGVQTKGLVLGLAKSEREVFSVRASALEAAGRLVPAEELGRELGPVLQGAREHAVRAVAANVLAERAGPASCGAIRAQAAKEQERARPAFTNALGRCGAAP